MNEESTPDLLDPKGSGYVPEPPWDDHDYSSDLTIVLTRDDAADFFGAVADLEAQALLSLGDDSYSIDYTEVAGAIINLSRIASEIGQQVDLEL